MPRPASLPPIVAALALAACGGDDTPVDSARAATPVPTATPTAAPEPVPAAASARERGVKLTVVRSDFGRIVGNTRGKAFYLFDKERRSRSECYGACAKAWPPVFAGGRPVAGKGIDPDLIGTTRRRSGRRQLTYAGQPMYYYVHDAPARVLCHDVVEFGGRWLVIRPDGTPAP